MVPISPVIDGVVEVVFAKDQPEYNPLPAIVSAGGCVTTRWRLSLRERLSVLAFGDLYLQISTFGKPLQPVKLTVSVPDSY